MNSRVFALSLLLYGSGLCALVYQTVWLRTHVEVWTTQTGDLLLVAAAEARIWDAASPRSVGRSGGFRTPELFRAAAELELWPTWTRDYLKKRCAFYQATWCPLAATPRRRSR